MADNYLERKMEELRSPRVTTSSNSTTRRVGLGWTLPKLRVAVVGDTSSLGHTIARAYVATGCRVTLLESENDVAKKLAREGVRFSTTVAADSISMTSAIASTLSEWRDIDVVIFCASEAVNIVASAIENHHSRFPAVGSYSPRFIILSRSNDSVELPENLIENAKNRRILYNKITLFVSNSISAVRSADSSDIARLCIFLSLPDSDFIQGADIAISFLSD